MASSATSSSTARPGSFAHVLAGLAAKIDRSAGADERDALADDVVTLSYAEALQRGRQRHSRAAAASESLTEQENKEKDSQESSDGPREPDDLKAEAACGEDREERGRDRAGKRKIASLTVRMSGAECAQVHARAAEAGMTVSAYLRSCVFEAENLRTQVKQALAEMRAAGTVDTNAAERPNAHGEAGRSSVRGWRTRLARWTGKRSTQS